MGYYSDVYLKTTTEGYLLLRRFSDSITPVEHRPLQFVDSIYKTPLGFYKIEILSVKWYEGRFPEVDNFMNGLDQLDEAEVPYSYIRIGEELDDIEHRTNYTSDTPDELYRFAPIVEVDDGDTGCYERVEETPSKGDE